MEIIHVKSCNQYNYFCIDIFWYCLVECHKIFLSDIFLNSYFLCSYFWSKILNTLYWVLTCLNNPSDLIYLCVAVRRCKRLKFVWLTIQFDRQANKLLFSRTWTHQETHGSNHEKLALENLKWGLYFISESWHLSVFRIQIK